MIRHKLLNHVKKYSTIGGIFKLIGKDFSAIQVSH